MITNDPANNAFYEERFIAIRDAAKAGDINAAAGLTVTAVNESEFSGPDAADSTYRALNAAAERIRNR
ncbi:hypothetical protein ABZW30_12470 [Kitasatospora sp. NPDC004669]|uniref:hypothetical protein n=1 Tax=Kitasatospora sp. NPDC004669 TaxID=3154555 RepID=UPI00339EC910